MTLSLTKPVAGQEFQQFPFPLNFLRKLGRGVVLDWQIFQSLGREKFVDAIFSVLSFSFLLVAGWQNKNGFLIQLHSSTHGACSTAQHFRTWKKDWLKVELRLERELSNLKWFGSIVLLIWKKSNFTLVHIS